ncbi:hypothetical protein J8273_4833 [Carpediemonas membranifera]|uniref:Uncharacterized protein n=1 Tax=Carpediemonas membranifera TaxID=201153 RepID=A0A8J6DZJ9_9EUKA|nr:hypothetical protein J8273_4833 [Carpediemonas membranifera]|eukprot:KAG9393714.1 hypothetical protein J8273_4833 [Carpediemonas membranifera]
MNAPSCNIVHGFQQMSLSIGNSHISAIQKTAVKNMVRRNQNRYQRVGYMDPFEPPSSVEFPYTEDDFRIRSMVHSVHFISGIIVITEANGVCAAYNRTTYRFLTFLCPKMNASVLEAFINPYSNEVVVIYTDTGHGPDRIFITAFAVDDIVRGEANPRPLFRRLNLRFPSYFEWSVESSAILIHDASFKRYVVFDMETYHPLFKFTQPPSDQVDSCDSIPQSSTRTIRDVRLSGMHILVIYTPTRILGGKLQPIRILTREGTEEQFLELKLWGDDTQIELLEYLDGVLLFRRRHGRLHTYSSQSPHGAIKLPQGSFRFAPLGLSRGVVGTGRDCRVVVPRSGRVVRTLPSSRGVTAAAGLYSLAGLGPDATITAASGISGRSGGFGGESCYVSTGLDELDSNAPDLDSLMSVVGAEQVMQVLFDEDSGTVFLAMATGSVMVHKVRG